MSTLVYILFEDNEPIGVYSSESMAYSEARAMHLKDWYILARGYK